MASRSIRTRSAQAAGTVVSRIADRAVLPAGESGRRDYRIRADADRRSSLSGTNCVGVVRALQRLSGGRLTPIPLQGPWSTARRSTGCSSWPPSSSIP